MSEKIEKIRSVCRDLLNDPRVRETMLWCLPAILLGIVLRGLITWSIPYGYVQDDTPDFLLTTYRFDLNWGLVLHSKKTFLTPILFTLAYLVKGVPTLLIIPIFQHLLGLVMTVMVGGIVRLWFRMWKVFIIPATVLTTANPAILWFEHALMAECHYLFCAMLVALLASAFVIFRSKGLFGLFLFSLVLTAGSRPEGKLFFLAGILLVGLMFWGNWKAWLGHMAVLSAVAIGTFAITKTTQAGTLLYATVLPLAPDVPKSAPDFGPRINPLRDQYRKEGVTVRRKLTTAEKTIIPIVKEYEEAEGIKDVKPADFCQKLAFEACLNKPGYLPAIALNKFLMSLRGPISVGLSEHWIYAKQVNAITGRAFMARLIRGLTGQSLATPQEIEAWLRAHETEPQWFGKLQQIWMELTVRRGLPAHKYAAVQGKVLPASARSKAEKDSGEEDQSNPGITTHRSDSGVEIYEIAGMPWFFILAFAGMLGAAIRPDRLRVFHLSWAASLLAIWFVVLLTGVVNARYRFLFEPFCALYALLLLDILSEAALGLLRSNTARPQPKYAG